MLHHNLGHGRLHAGNDKLTNYSRVSAGHFCHPRDRLLVVARNADRRHPGRRSTCMRGTTTMHCSCTAAALYALPLRATVSAPPAPELALAAPAAPRAVAPLPGRATRGRGLPDCLSVYLSTYATDRLTPPRCAHCLRAMCVSVSLSVCTCGTCARVGNQQQKHFAQGP